MASKIFGKFCRRAQRRLQAAIGLAGVVQPYAMPLKPEDCIDHPVIQEFSLQGILNLEQCLATPLIVRVTPFTSFLKRNLAFYIVGFAFDDNGDLKACIGNALLGFLLSQAISVASSEDSRLLLAAKLMRRAGTIYGLKSELGYPTADTPPWVIVVGPSNQIRAWMTLGADILMATVSVLDMVEGLGVDLGFMAAWR